MSNKEISSKFQFKSKFINILGSNMHYIDEGDGDPILFLHGNPTSSYLWRNIIPHLSSSARCIAVDLIGMGKSDKPDINYRFAEHSRYLNEFINKLQLKNITLVVHDWGSGLGFDYAMKNEDNIKGIAFMESIIKPINWSDFPSGFKIGFKLFRNSFAGWLMISVFNMFINKVLPGSIVRKLTQEEMKYYREPFKKIKHRKPVRQWPCEIPIEGKPEDVYEIVKNYNMKLKESPVPKILFYAHPGGLITSSEVQWCIDNLKNIEAIDIGRGIHYLQEDNPHLIGEELSRWYKKMSKFSSKTSSHST